MDFHTYSNLCWMKSLDYRKPKKNTFVHYPVKNANSKKGLNRELNAGPLTVKYLGDPKQEFYL